ncbi:hypothetical protein AB0D38_13880 [Streptomyces sp. NPDC048279]
MALRDIVGSVVVDHLYTSDHAPEPPESRSPRNRTAHSILLMGPTAG